jgi:hypothetical protein
MTVPYADRILEFAFTLGEGASGESRASTISYRDLRATAEIELDLIEGRGCSARLA